MQGHGGSFRSGSGGGARSVAAAALMATAAISAEALCQAVPPPPTPLPPAIAPEQGRAPERGAQPAKQDPIADPDAAVPAISSVQAAGVGRVGARAGENAVRQAEDAFGFSVGRETLGLYSAGNVRGFSPLAAGNARIEGLYYDVVLPLTSRVRQSTSIRVGLSAQGYPFPSPTGIVDYSLRKPGDRAAVSALVDVDSLGTYGAEFDAALPVTGNLSVGFGGQAQRNRYPNGTTGKLNSEAMLVRWQPAPDLEVLPFAVRYQISDDLQGPIYIPAGDFLPPRIPRVRYDGPGWNTYNTVGAAQGLLVTASPFADWTVRGGFFHSLYNEKSNFAQLFDGLERDGTARRIILADPPSRFESFSGELRASRALTEGPRLHVLHLSFRGRDRRQRYVGSDVLDYGPTRIGEAFFPAKPELTFSQQLRDRVRQTAFGVAYDGRWRGVGELSVGVSRTDYNKVFDLPGIPRLEVRSQPWIWNVTAAGYLGPRLTVYGGYARGLEESGVAPDNAVNRNQPLPAILTRQFDAGVRFTLNDRIKLVGGVFDLRKPYYNLDAADRFTLLGDVVSRGVEFSVSGAVTPRLSVVAGGVLLRPRVTGQGVALGRVGRRPVGLSPRSLDLNVDWRPEPLPGFSFDVSASNIGHTPSVVDNAVSIPSRTLVDLGTRYAFKLGGRDATVRAQVSNVGNVYGYDLRGAGAYDLIAGRIFSGYLTIDF